MTTIQSESPSSFSPEKGVYRWLILLLIFLSALSVRLYNLDVPPMDFHPTRQYRSFLLAKALYAESSGNMKKSDKEIALAAKPALLEPPIAESPDYIIYDLRKNKNVN